MSRKYFLVYTLVVMTFLLGAGSTFAAGSGSGGATPPPPPSCTADTWDCGAWGACSSQGRQTRSCVLVSDCPSDNSPAPSGEQTCTPSPPPAPAVQQPVKPPTSPPPPAVKPEPLCLKDVWECGQWGACDSDGKEQRSCRMVRDCSTAQTPSPETVRPCPSLQCGNKTTLRERALCRLKLSPAGVVRELEIEYLPEECRTVTDKTVRASCIAAYKAYKPCWSKSVGEERFGCARSVLKLGPILSDAVKTCQGKTGDAQAACKREVREKVFSMIKFRFYDLEERAEELIKRGADRELVADLVVFITNKKQEFNKASTAEARRQVISDVREGWQTFVREVKSQIH